MAQKDLYNDLSSIPSQVDDRLRLFNHLIQRGFGAASEENKTFGKYQKYVLENALTEADIKALRMDKRSTLNYPILKPYIQRSIKNVIDAAPTLSIVPTNEDDTDKSSALPSTTIAEILDLKMKNILQENHWESILFRIAQDAWIGGKGIFEVATEYKNERGFDQKFSIKSVEDPTTIVFDPRARSLTKEDGEFAAKLCPMNKEDVESYWPDIPWSEIEAQGKWTNRGTTGNRFNWYQGDSQFKIAVICEMYYKQYETTTIYLLSDGQIVEEELTKEQKEMGLVVRQQREVRRTRIYRTRFCGKLELESPCITNFNKLPLIRCPGEIIYKNGKECLIPYAQHAFDAQRTKNFLMNFFLNEALNHDRGTWLIAKESMDSQDVMNLKHPMDNFVLRYKQYGESETNGNEMVSHNPPAYVQPAEIPTQFLEAFSMLDGTIEKILGNQFPSINEVDLSGKALYNMADFMSASNEVFMQHLMESIQCVGQTILNAIPTVLSSELVGFVGKNEDPTHDSAPLQQVMHYDFDFEEGAYLAKITRGVNYKLQQQKNVEMLLEFGKMYPPLLQFLFTDGFKFMIGNMDFNDKEALAQAYNRHQQKMEEMKENPEMAQMQQMAMAQKQAELKTQQVNAQAHLMKAQTDQQKLALEGAKLQHSKHEIAADDMLEMHKISADLSKNRLDNLTKLFHIKSTDENIAKRMQEHGQTHH